MDAKRRKIQLELAFMADGRGEAPMAADKGTEASKAKRKPEDPALPVLLMEEICQRENLRKALQRVKQNKGSPGIDGMTVKNHCCRILFLMNLTKSWGVEVIALCAMRTIVISMFVANERAGV